MPHATGLLGVITHVELQLHRVRKIVPAHTEFFLDRSCLSVKTVEPFFADMDKYQHRDRAWTQARAARGCASPQAASAPAD